MAIAAMATAATAGDEMPRLSTLSWMTGTWIGEDKGGVSMDEAWGEPRGRMLFGLHRDIDIKDDRVVSWEFLRIEERPEGFSTWRVPRARQPRLFGSSRALPSERCSGTRSTIFQSASSTGGCPMGRCTRRSMAVRGPAPSSGAGFEPAERRPTVPGATARRRTSRSGTRRHARRRMPRTQPRRSRPPNGRAATATTRRSPTRRSKAARRSPGPCCSG